MPRVLGVPENPECFVCHSDKDLSKKAEDGKTISLFVDEMKYAASVHGKQTCVACHSDTTETPHPDGFKAKAVDCAKCHQQQSDEYGASVHGLAREHSNGKAATCIDCHGVHEAVKHTSPESPLHHFRLAQTCGKCHSKATTDIARSVHGKTLAKGVQEAPTCTDCHSEHKIEKLAGASPRKISENVCSRCHASERLNTKFRIPGDRVKTFFDSYHGLAVRLNSTQAANCASCHGWHDILPSSDLASWIHPNNLPKTCGECHPDIGTRIAKGAIHVHTPPGAAEGKHWIVNFIAWFYIIIIILTIGAMFAHNALDYIAKTRLHIRRVAATGGEQRLGTWVRAQHLVMIVLFVLLAYTGFVHKYPEAWWSWPFHAMPGGNYIRGLIHRVTGWIFTGLLAGHCLALFGTAAGRAELRALWMKTKDLRDVVAMIGFNLGLRSAPPDRERYNYVEKSEYWALMWGSIVMILTGIMLIFTEVVLHFLPQVWLDVAQVIHFYEALLATLAILVWHLYAVVFDPHVYPMNPAWLIGKKPIAHPRAKPEKQADAAP